MATVAGFDASLIFTALPVFGSAGAGSAIGWLVSSRLVGAPFNYTLAGRTCSIVILAAPYFLLTIVMAGMQAGIAALLAMFAGPVIYCAFRFAVTSSGETMG
jgi:hypothetical protein